MMQNPASRIQDPKSASRLLQLPVKPYYHENWSFQHLSSTRTVLRELGMVVIDDDACRMRASPTLHAGHA
jgi:hypothetical protein